MNNNRIKYLRVEHGLNQTELAKKLNVTATTVSRYESGILDVSTEAIGIMCNLFNVSADYLLGTTIKRNNEAANINDEYIEVIQSAKRKNISPAKLKQLIEFLETN